MLVLRLGTRRSALAQAQSLAVARSLERCHPHVQVELVGIDTRGDRILDQPLSSVDGKEFFTAEIDAALLGGRVDFTVHSFKDLSLERSASLCLAAVPRREQPRDIVLFAPDCQARLAAGATLRIGSSSPRRASFIPPVLQQLLPWRAGSGARTAAAVTLVGLRGNVDSRLRRLLEPRGSERHLDGIVLALAGLARLWADDGQREALAQILERLPRMVMPLSLCPGAPAQGALGIECRADDARTRALLAALDDAPTREAVRVERALLAERGGGCHQRFGATLETVEGLGSLLYTREASGEAPAQLADTRVQWTPLEPLPQAAARPVPWDGSRAERAPVEPEPAGVEQAAVAGASAWFITHRRALPESITTSAPHCWVPGVETWRALAERGLWVEGCAEGLGFAWLRPLIEQPVLQLPAIGRWRVLTHAEALPAWRTPEPGPELIATYRHRPWSAQDEAGMAETVNAVRRATHLWWHSGAQFEQWRQYARADAEHACAPGKTAEHLRRAGCAPLRIFPRVSQWREWLRR